MTTIAARAYRYMSLDYMLDERIPVTLYAIESRDLYLLVTHQDRRDDSGSHRPITGGPQKDVAVGRLSHLSKHDEIFEHLRSDTNTFAGEAELPEATVRAVEELFTAQERFRGHWAANFVLYAPDLEKWGTRK